MTPDDQKKLLIAKVQAMISEVEDRTGRNAYSDFPLETYTLEELEKIRRDLHEVLYAPPPRMR